MGTGGSAGGKSAGDVEVMIAGGTSRGGSENVSRAGFTLTGGCQIG